MSATAIPLPAEREPTAEDRLHLMTEHAHDLIGENTRLACALVAAERELARLAADHKSRLARNRVLWQAANAKSVGNLPVAHIAVARAEAKVEPMLRIARALEAEGKVPVVRFARDAAGEIVGIDFGRIAPDERTLPVAEMAVEGDEAFPESGAWRGMPLALVRGLERT